MTEYPDKAKEKSEDAVAALCEVLGPDKLGGRRLFIGNRVAADDAALLLRHDITSTMNLAVNIELSSLALGDGTVVRRTHIGLIDGPGNTPQHLLGAVLTLHGLLGQDSPGKASYPPHRKGNVLVHCRGGRSRSAGMLALYLCLAFPEEFRALDDALAHMRSVRGLPLAYPLPAMIELGQAVLEHRRALTPLFSH